MRAGILLCCAASASADVWQPIRNAVDSFPLLPNMVLAVGNESGQVFYHEKGATKVDSVMHIFSASKIIAGVTIMKGVEEGHLSLDDLASKYLDYWTKDPQDPRSKITLRHLLSFEDEMTRAGTSCPANKFLDCVKYNYNKDPGTGEDPGEHFYYGEYHLQVGMAMLQHAKGRTGPTDHVDLVKEAILEPLGMTATYYEEPENPDFSSNIHTHSIDYDKFLHAFTTYKLVSKATYDDMGVAHYPDAKLDMIGPLLGRYGLANWYECILNLGNWRDECTEEHSMSCPGAAGYWPVTARKEGYYFHIATSGGPANSGILRVLVKPMLDAIMTGKEVPPPQYDNDQIMEMYEQLKEPFERAFKRSPVV